MCPTDDSTPDPSVQTPLDESSGKAPSSAQHTGQWREPFNEIEDFVDHAKKSADIQPAVYALDRDRQAIH